LRENGTLSATEQGRSSSSSEDLLLQGIILEDAFQELNPRTLIPFLKQFDSTDTLQNFLDMANAVITAAKVGPGKPVQNPFGFLFAQLRSGYINPPEGYKSRKVRAQEFRNQQLEQELAALKQIKERETELRFELFKIGLTEDAIMQLEREAQSQVKPNLGLSRERQIEIHKDTILRQWFDEGDSKQQS
jgi:hypothetical protein